MRVSPSLVIAGASATVLVAAAAPATASTYVAGPVVSVSGAPGSPLLATCTAGADDVGGVNYPDTEVEPFVAVNPADPQTVVGVYQQDRWSNGGSRGLTTAYSADGGGTWKETAAAFSECSGGEPQYDRASDPWVSFDTAGRAYQVSLSVSADQATSAVLAATSTDGGVHWSPPVTLIRDTDPLHFNDKESVTADPTRPGFAYAVWDRGTFPSDNSSQRAQERAFSFRGQPLISRTTDGGATWSAPEPMTGANLFTIGNQIAVQPDGTLIDVASTSRGSGIQPSGQQSFISVSTSKDAGLHWSGFQQIATLAPVQGCGVEDVCDPDTVGSPNPLPVRAGTEIPDVAVDPVTGRIYVVWADGRASGGTVPGVVISSSLNGRTWTPPVRVADSPVGVASFNGTVAVASDGTVGVLYYDFRDNTPAPGVPTTVRLAHSHDNGVTWTDQQTLGSTFDMENAPFARGFFLGDYQGLTAIGRDFLAFYSVAGTAKSTADVVAVRARPAA